MMGDVAWKRAANTCRTLQILSTVTAAVVCARGMYRAETIWETDASTWACTAFGVSSGALVVAWFVAQWDVENTTIWNNTAFVCLLLSQLITGYATGTVLFDATVAGSHLGIVSRAASSAIGIVALLLGLGVMHAGPNSEKESNVIGWNIACTLLAGGWIAITYIVSGLMDAVPGEKVVAYAETAGWAQGDATFVHWASTRVHVLRKAGMSVFGASVAGSAFMAVACGTYYYRSFWPYLAILSMSIAAVVAGSIAPMTSVLQATRGSTRSKPFPAYMGNATSDVAFVKFGEDSLVDVDLWTVSGQWWILAIGLAVMHAFVIGLFRVVG